MDALQAELEARGDARKHFVATYRRTTLAVAEEMTGGLFRDPGWVERWDVAFADLYLGPLADDLAGLPVPGPWGGGLRVLARPAGRPPRSGTCCWG